MAREPAIIVRRQLVDVAVGGSERDGAAVQRQLSACVSDVVASSLTAAFRLLDLGDDHLVVEHLAVDVDAAGLEHLDDAIADAVRREAEELIRHHVPVGPSPPSGSPDDGPVVRRSAVSSIGEAFAEFLTSGRLPWGFALEPGTDLETVIRSAWERSDRNGVRPGWPWGSEFLADQRRRTRLVLQCSETFVVEVVRRLDPSVGAALAAALHLSSSPAPLDVGAESVASSSVGDDRFAVAWRRALTRVAVESVAVGDARNEVALVLAAVSELDPAVAARAEVMHWVAERWPEAHPTLSEVPTVATAMGSAESAGRTDAVEELASASGSGTFERRPESSLRPRAPDSWLVDHAGVVLFHPFLPRFFEGLGLCEQPARLTDPGRAVGLLHHLVTGAESVPEHETTVAKILCGLPLDAPVEREPGFTADELDEAEALVDAVIRHWDALGRTGPAAVRAEFLSRPGLLCVDVDDDWVLRVEQRTADILLGQLPWGLSMVQTPWMDQMMRVEWGS